MTNKIYVIEDCVKEANAIAKELNKKALIRETENCSFQFSVLPGTIAGEIAENDYMFYDDSVLNTIRERYDELQDDERMCILLDIMLTKEDYSNARASSYPKVDLAKKIYFEFREQMPIYIITHAPWFATQGDVVMGVDLSEQFISKNAILRYKLEEDINRLFDFFKKEEIENA